jgi:hypothetical protein
MYVGKLTPDQYFEQFNQAMAATFAECEAVLGKRDFERLFDASAEDASHLIDPEIFFAPHK